MTSASDMATKKFNNIDPCSFRKCRNVEYPIVLLSEMTNVN